MSSRVTRRELAALLTAPALLAQTPAPAADLAQSVRDQMQRNRELLAKVDVPVTVEPAVHFKV